ncbi:hypothetical protein OIO90_000728 [Microbotryomycetes sp. JL221]|nr:hypothetical protein OIO90_000728 [Microbotryomycetes sp. JL221]
MTLKRELQTWAEALGAHDSGNLQVALRLFKDLTLSSKIAFNMAMIYSQLDNQNETLTFCERAIELDPFLAVAHFQAGISCYKLGRFNDAKRCFGDALIYLRSNALIDYEQLGLKFRLYACEILFNRALASFSMGMMDESYLDLKSAAAQKQTTEHRVIDNGLHGSKSSLTLFEIVDNVLFRPTEIKLKNLETRNYLGQPKLIAAASVDDAHITFERQMQTTDKNRSRRFPRPKRSNTTAARIETVQSSESENKSSSLDGFAKPLVEHHNLTTKYDLDGPHPKTPTRLGRSQTVGASSASLPFKSAESSLQNRAATPFSKSGAYVTPGYPSLDQPEESAVYVGEAFLDSYLIDEPSPLPSIQPLSTSKIGTRNQTSRSSSSTNTDSPVTAPLQVVDTPQLLSRVATWARHRAAASMSKTSTSSRRHATHNRSSSEIQSLQRGPTSATCGQLEQQDSNAARPQTRRDSLTSISEHLASLISTPDTSRDAQPYRYETVPSNTPSTSSYKLELEPSTKSPQVGSAIEADELKIRVKVKAHNEVRALIVSNRSSLSDFQERMRIKFERSFETLTLKYRDPDGLLVTLGDQDDWECALEESSFSGKLEVLIE